MPNIEQQKAQSLHDIGMQLQSMNKKFAQIVKILETLNSNLVLIGRDLVPPKAVQDERQLRFPDMEPEVTPEPAECDHVAPAICLGAKCENSRFPGVRRDLLRFHLNKANANLGDRVKVVDLTSDQFGFIGRIVNGRGWPENVEICVRFEQGGSDDFERWFPIEVLEKQPPIPADGVE